MTKGYTAFVLPESERTLLSEFIPFTHPVKVAHHITYEFGVEEESIIPDFNKFFVVKIIDRDGIQALVVKTDEGNLFRPDGKVFHITWSHNEDKKPVQSNDVISKYFELDSLHQHMDLPVTVVPTFIPF